MSALSSTVVARKSTFKISTNPTTSSYEYELSKSSNASTYPWFLSNLHCLRKSSSGTTSSNISTTNTSFENMLGISLLMVSLVKFIKAFRPFSILSIPRVTSVLNTTSPVFRSPSLSSLIPSSERYNNS